MVAETAVINFYVFFLHIVTDKYSSAAILSLSFLAHFVQQLYSRAVPSMQYVRMQETLWHKHMFYACKAFTESDANRKLFLATCHGRQHGSDVWLLNEPLQIWGSDGQPIVIPVDEQQYYWHPHYRYVFVAVAIA